MSTDKTKEILEQILADLYQKQATTGPTSATSYLRAQDEQFLGTITSNTFDTNSILNKYGPFGSPYSTTSIFNEYSDYGSRYGSNSVKNPYCATPPKLIIGGRLLGYVTVNPYVSDKIDTETFLYTLRNDIRMLLAGRIVASSREIRQQKGESFIEAGDGSLLGRLNPNRWDEKSIFNRFGIYGSNYSPSSIFNRFSTYGNQFSSLSPYNRFSTNPPKLYVKGKFVAFLTKNQTKHPRVDPDDLLSWAKQNVSRLD